MLQPKNQNAPRVTQLTPYVIVEYTPSEETIQDAKERCVPNDLRKAHGLWTHGMTVFTVDEVEVPYPTVGLTMST